MNCPGSLSELVKKGPKTDQSMSDAQGISTHFAKGQHKDKSVKVTLTTPR